MQTKHLCVLIHMWTKGEVGTPWNRLKLSNKNFLLTFQCGSFVLFMSYVCHAFVSVHCCLVVTCWERADLLALVWDVYCDFVTFSFGILGQVWYLIVLIPDPCCLSYFNIPINSYCQVHVPVYWYPEWKELNGMIWKESIFNLTYQAFS